MSVKLKISQINKNLVDKQIFCLSTDNDYINNKCLLSWKCLICESIFIKSKNTIDKDFKQCQNCRKTNALAKAQACVNQKGGILLTTKYLGSHCKLKCICKNGHEFNISYNNLVNIGNWCSYCSHGNYISEEICRAYFESLFQEKFIKIRPIWLKKDNNYALELDGYCEKLSIAFEHNGMHHYEINSWGRDHTDTKNNDSIKKKLCEINNVKLIIIPSLFKIITLPKLKNFIIEQCNILSIIIPYPEAFIDLSLCYDDDIFQEYKDIALNKGGKCISENYLGGTNEKLIWECKFGHQWKQFPYVIKKGNWCPVCAGQKHSVNILNKL